MRFVIISHAPHIKNDSRLYAYSPYVKEMNMWLNHVDDVEIVAPKSNLKPTLIDESYEKNEIELTSIPEISLRSIYQILRAILLSPMIMYRIFIAMKKADHIHLRCPGNIGLLGCLVQILFPSKTKTVKYAGNWDAEAKQPLSYKLQKYILNNTFLTKNIKVLVYGEWPNQSKNILSFFTASYSIKDKEEVILRKYDLPLRFLFIGSLSQGKRPLYALKLVEGIIKLGLPSEIHIYGDGVLKRELQQYVNENKLEKFVYYHGTQAAEEIKDAYKKSHFLILPSKSEGWPKVVAEAMWWGVIPIVPSVSCVPWMLGNGSRGILIKGRLKKDIKKIEKELQNKNALRTKSNKAQLWARNYTLERFESEITKLS
tara:strand:+ start:988 stop:2100 length:1113 start_codon:yes stop_codon:yes gene_type:complete